MKNSTKKVAVIYTHFPHYREAIFSKLTDSQKFEYIFFYDSRGVEKTIKSGVQYKNHEVIRNTSIKNFYFQWDLFRLLLRKDIKAFIFLGNPYIITTWMLAPLLKAKGCPVFFWTHGWNKEEYGLKKFLRSSFYHLADGLMLYGNRAKSIGIKNNFSPNKLHVIYNSLDYELQKKQRSLVKKLDQPISKPYFLSVSRLIADVELELAIQAIAILKNTSAVEVYLVIVGDGPIRSKLEKLAHELNAPVDFLGAIYEENQLAQLFCNAVAVVSPGKVGLLAMHSLAYGTHVITHNDLDHQMPEVEAISPEVSGAFFSRGNVNELAEVMSKYLKHKPDPIPAIEIIETNYNPEAQRKYIEAVLSKSLKLDS